MPYYKYAGTNHEPVIDDATICTVDDCIKVKPKPSVKYCEMHRSRLRKTGRLDNKKDRLRL